jgi:Na+-transporting NADH:ubiquinone oxidoreductase subunit F
MVLVVTTLNTLLYSIIVFLVIIMALVFILLIARDKLSPKGDVRLNINDREFIVSPGSNLLSTLSSN